MSYTVFVYRYTNRDPDPARRPHPAANARIDVLQRRETSPRGKASLALTLDAGPGHGDTANARIQLLGGVLVIAAPYLLGSLADQLGLRAAFTVEPVLIGACGLLLLAGLRLRA